MPSATSEEGVKEKPVPSAAECQYALLEFEKPVTCLPDSIVIGSRLDTDAHILPDYTSTFMSVQFPLNSA